MQTFLTLSVSLLCAWGCHYFAKQRGLNARNWCIAGFFLGVIALIILFFVPKRKMRAFSLPNKRLSPPSALTIIQPDHEGKLWYFIDAEKNQLGPMSFAALNSAWHEGKIIEKTFVWNEAMENWRPLQEVIQSSSQRPLAD